VRSPFWSPDPGRGVRLRQLSIDERNAKCLVVFRKKIRTLPFTVCLKSRVKFITQLGFMYTLAARKCLVRLNTMFVILSVSICVSMCLGLWCWQPMLRQSYILLVVDAAPSGWNGRPLTDRWPPSRVARNGLVGGSVG